MRFKIYQAAAGAVGWAAVATGATAISYAPPANFNTLSDSICGISTVFAPGLVSISTVYITSLPDSPATLHESISGTVTVTVAPNSSPILSTIYETVTDVTATLYVTISTAPASGSSTISSKDAISTTSLVITPGSETTSTRTPTLPQTLAVQSSSTYTETLTTSLAHTRTLTIYGADTTEVLSLSDISASADDYISYYVEGTTTVWLGKTPSAGQSFVYITKAVTVVPVNLPPTTTILETEHTTSTLHSALIVTTTIPAQSIATSSNLPESTGVSLAPYPLLNATSSAGPTAISPTLFPIEYSNLIYQTSHTLVTVSTLNAQSGFLQGSAISPHGVLDTSMASPTSQPAYYAPYSVLNTTLSIGVTGISSSSTASTTSDNSPIGMTSSSLTISRSSSVYYGPYPALNTHYFASLTSNPFTVSTTSDNSPVKTSSCSESAYYASYPTLSILPSISTLSTGSLSSFPPLGHTTSDNSPLGSTSSSSATSRNTLVSYVPYLTLNTTLSVGPLATGSLSSSSLLISSTTSDNSPTGTTSNSSASATPTGPPVYMPYPGLNTTSSGGPLATRSIILSPSLVSSTTSDNSPAGTSSSPSAVVVSTTTPVYYVPYLGLNTTFSTTVLRTGGISTLQSSIGSTTSDNSPVGITSSTSNASSSSFLTVYSPSSASSTASARSVAVYGGYSYAPLSSSTATSVGAIHTSSSSSSFSSLSPSGYYAPSLTSGGSTVPTSFSTLALSSTPRIDSTISDNSPVETDSVYGYSTSVASQGSSTTATTLTSQASASATTCGEQGNFTLTFDDVPPLSISNTTDPDSVSPLPIFNPYHQFDFSTGFTVVPPPTDPYLPSSGKLLLEFIPNFGGTNYQASSNSLGYSGAISDGDHGLAGCFTFNFYGASLGCDSKGPDCEFAFSGYRLDGQVLKEVTSQQYAIPACPALANCSLTPFAADDTFQDLNQIRISVTVGGMPKIWWMDDLNLGWFNNSCASGLCRQKAHVS